MKIELELPDDILLITLCPRSVRTHRPKNGEAWFIQIESTETVDRRWEHGIGDTPQQAADVAVARLRESIAQKGKALYTIPTKSETLSLDLDLSGL